MRPPARRREPLDRILDRAHRAFEVSMRAAGDGCLWGLHAALEKRQVVRVVRGSWGDAQQGACPLTVLALGRAPRSADELRETAIRAEDRLREHGLHARDFYAAWDAGLIPSRFLLRMVDEELTRRALAPRRTGT
jgi:hypothetical protein